MAIDRPTIGKNLYLAADHRDIDFTQTLICARSLVTELQKKTGDLKEILMKMSPAAREEKIQQWDQVVIRGLYEKLGHALLELEHLKLRCEDSFVARQVHSENTPYFDILSLVDFIETDDEKVKQATYLEMQTVSETYPELRITEHQWYQVLECLRELVATMELERKAEFDYKQMKEQHSFNDYRVHLEYFKVKKTAQQVFEVEQRLHHLMKRIDQTNSMKSA